MKMRNKGKVHPSPSSSSSSSASPTTTKDVLSILKLLPATILTLASVLSLQDKEVLAYMITRSLKTTINPLNIPEEKSKKTSTPNSKNTRNNNNNVSHKPPMFDCECFDCYTSFWSKWNSSPSRELIHQAIEAFEEHLSTSNVEGSSSSGKNNKGRSKKKERMSRRGVENAKESVLENQESSQEITVLENGSPENADVEAEEVVVEAPPPVLTAARGSGSSHKGLARKVLPDVLGLFNSRLWSLWGPNV